jgi:Tfp pilus assembly protein PilZ
LRERRKFPRVMCNVRTGSGEATEASVKNISAGGICIMTEVPLQLGKLIRLRFTLPDGMEMEMNGNVAWCLAVDSALYENGIDFLPFHARYGSHLTRILN